VTEDLINFIGEEVSRTTKVIKRVYRERERGNARKNVRREREREQEGSVHGEGVKIHNLVVVTK